MTHHSRLGVIVIDCRTDDLTDALAFWTAALGYDGSVDDDGRYAVIKTPDGHPAVLLQSVDHASRIHIDIETDDREAEADRLETLGAKRIGPVKGWIVMEAPTGHRFCLVKPQRADFPDRAKAWPTQDG